MVQPRVCGERPKSVGMPKTRNGSAPRVRGTRACTGWCHADGRFSPACAGNARPRIERLSPVSVQPRVCGERVFGEAHPAIEGGSAPRVRGTLGREVPEEHRCRFSPACAGNASRAAKAVDLEAVQPRVCGERLAIVALDRKCHGSAPRVRGTHRTRWRSTNARRFSPACAGNASHQLSKRGLASVQPRVCGERSRVGMRSIGVGGSAPRVRGTPRKTCKLYVSHRFSPACAGNACFAARNSRASSVQPRVCGERCKIGPRDSEQRGSAPRVRGTPLVRRGFVRVGRFSPACAGNAWRPLAAIKSSAVQPRVCGERLRKLIRICLPCGSAPRVRGTRHARINKINSERFSPACAGNASRRPGDADQRAVQPRVCGERPASRALLSTMRGSAPRVRGTPRNGIRRSS